MTDPVYLALQRQHMFDHARCPKCFKHWDQTTCMGFFRDKYEGELVLVDRNTVRCVCGWSGNHFECVSEAVGSGD